MTLVRFPTGTGPPVDQHPAHETLPRRICSIAGTLYRHPPFPLLLIGFTLARHARGDNRATLICTASKLSVPASGLREV